MRTVEAALIIEPIGERQDGRDQWLTINPENHDVSCHPVPPLDRPHLGREEGFDHRSHIVRLMRSHIQRKFVEWPRPRLCSPTGAAILPALLAPPATDSSIGFTSSASAPQMSHKSIRNTPALQPFRMMTSLNNIRGECTVHCAPPRIMIRCLSLTALLSSLFPRSVHTSTSGEGSCAFSPPSLRQMAVAGLLRGPGFSVGSSLAKFWADT